MLKQDAEEEKTREQLIQELAQLKDRIAELEKMRNNGIVRDLNYFSERLEEEVARSTRYKYEFSVIILEMDNFEEYNKKFGNPVADEVVSMLGQTVKNSIRRSDMSCHFDGSKYGLLLPFTNVEGASIAAERVRQITERVLALKSLSSHINLTLSMGLSAFPRDAMLAEQLVSMAENALASAKARGGNCICHALGMHIGSEMGQASGQEVTRNQSLLQFLDDEITRCSRYGMDFSLIIFNVRSAGNNTTGSNIFKLLKIVEVVLARNLRAVDRSYWYSEGKYAIVLPNTYAGGARNVAQKLLQIIIAALNPNPGAGEAGIVVDLGIASFPTDGVVRDSLINQAYRASDLARKKGNNQIVMASSFSSHHSDEQRDVTEYVKNAAQSGSRGGIYNLLAAVDSIEHYVKPHSQNVAKYAIEIGQALNLPGKNLRQLRIMALLHDIGKVSLPVSVIRKPASLSDHEQELVQRHPELGAKILEQSQEFAFCAPVVLAHHERFDGKGYPNRLKGDQIPVEAGIIAVAEAYDDMISPRPYHKQISPTEAFAELKVNAGTQFNPNLVAALIKVESKSPGLTMAH